MKWISINSNGLLFAFRMILGCLVVWWSLFYLHDNKKIWALISVIVVSDPDFDVLRTATYARVINTVTGCIIGLVVIFVAGVSEWSLMGGIALAVVVSTSFKNYPSNWKLAPATVAIIILSAMTENAVWKDAMIISLERSGEVLYGSVVAFLLGFIMSVLKKRWPHRFPTVAKGEEEQ